MTVKCSEVKAGDILIADGGFDCLRSGQHCKVYEKFGDFFVDCDSGTHNLEGQLDYDTGTEYVGFIKGEA